MLFKKKGFFIYSNEPVDSSFYMTFKVQNGEEEQKKFKETIEYTSRLDNKNYNYVQPCGETILMFMNNYQKILGMIGKYNGLFEQIEYNDFRNNTIRKRYL